MMNTAYKTGVSNILKSDPEDEEFGCFINFVESNSKGPLKMSSASNQKRIQDMFIEKSAEFLKSHSKTYEETKKVRK